MLQREQIKKIFLKNQMPQFIFTHDWCMSSFDGIFWNPRLCHATIHSSVQQLGHRKPKGVNWSYFLVLIRLLFCSALQFMVSQHNDITQSNQRFDVHSELTSREEVRGPKETLTPHQDKTLNFTEFIDILSTLPNVPLFQMLNQLPGRGDSCFKR